MDPWSGDLYRLHTDGKPGDLIQAADALEQLAEPLDEEREARLRKMIDEDRPLVQVDEEVVQKLRLGERELRRRKQRR